jgi:hypothetical protein
MNRLWPVLVPLAGVIVALALWWGFADGLHLTDKQRVVYRAILAGIAIAGAVKVLLRLNPSGLSSRGQAPDPSSLEQRASRGPERREDDR